ncbi:hypothetical protein OH76DRAFT_778462 [Lentinus brumalis]|uniref:Uncharacterized protein n=1 Tax=Lentinus brumalis TaxID=2498619 RepID=A0A371D4H1_9APHY|nr:hypothetical protein OH76DRAFT_778462 [Polyporus brumalis]
MENKTAISLWLSGDRERERSWQGSLGVSRRSHRARRSCMRTLPGRVVATSELRTGPHASGRVRTRALCSDTFTQRPREPYTHLCGQDEEAGLTRRSFSIGCGGGTDLTGWQGRKEGGYCGTHDIWDAQDTGQLTMARRRRWAAASVRRWMLLCHWCAARGSSGRRASHRCVLFRARRCACLGRLRAAGRAVDVDVEWVSARQEAKDNVVRCLALGVMRLMQEWLEGLRVGSGGAGEDEEPWASTDKQGESWSSADAAPELAAVRCGCEYGEDVVPRVVADVGRRGGISRSTASQRLLPSGPEAPI